MKFIKKISNRSFSEREFDYLKPAIGATIGATVGAIGNSAFGDKKKSSKKKAIEGAFIGGLIGAGGTIAYDHLNSGQTGSNKSEGSNNSEDLGQDVVKKELPFEKRVVKSILENQATGLRAVGGSGIGLGAAGIAYKNVPGSKIKKSLAALGAGIASGVGTYYGTKPIYDAQSWIVDEKLGY